MKHYYNRMKGTMTFAEVLGTSRVETRMIYLEA